MDAAALAGLCAMLAHGAPATTLPSGVRCPAAMQVQGVLQPPALRALVGSPTARDAIARVTYAEAGNQGDSGLAAVVYTILNRLQDGRWGSEVDAVLNARAQFEPVMRAGGDWRRLAPVSAAEQARIDTILNLALDGRLPDLTNGARFFQNPTTVAARARAGTVSSALVDFGGAQASAQIGAHRFYVDAVRGRGGGAASATRSSSARMPTGEGVLFVGAAALTTASTAVARTAPGPALGDPSHALFVGADGRVSATQP
jgi:N-acetylmuramoyl-L-alanine amidase